MTDLAGAAGWWQNEITGNYMRSDNPKRRPIRNKNAEPYVLEMNHVLPEPNVTTTWILMVEWGQRRVWSPPGGVNLGNKIVIQRETGSSLFLWVMRASPSWCQSKKKTKKTKKKTAEVSLRVSRCLLRSTTNSTARKIILLRQLQSAGSGNFIYCKLFPWAANYGNGLRTSEDRERQKGL